MKVSKGYLEFTVSFVSLVRIFTEYLEQAVGQKVMKYYELNSILYFAQANFANFR